MVIGKIRSEVASAESQQQHSRAAKALLIIIPLLGITYLITMFPPVNTEGMGYQIFQYARSILLSTQGFVITLPYCFLNTEVKSVLKNNFERWKTNRSLDNSSANTRSTRNSISMAGYYSTTLNTTPGTGDNR